MGTRTPISCHESPIGKNIIIPNKNRSRERIPDHDRKNCRQHDSLYYQPQHGVPNQRQQFLNDRIIQQASYKNDYDGDKGVAYGMISSGIPTPEKQATPIIPLKKDYNSRKKHQQIHLQIS